LGSIPLEHYFLNFGGIKVYNKIKMFKESLFWVGENEKYEKVYKPYENVDGEILADLIYKINSQHDRDIEEQYCL